jgi:hypothetical protein
MIAGQIHTVSADNFRVARHPGVIAKFTGPVLRLADIAIPWHSLLVDLFGFFWNGWDACAKLDNVSFRLPTGFPLILAITGHRRTSRVTDVTCIEK